MQPSRYEAKRTLDAGTEMTAWLLSLYRSHGDR
jgi:hypothetical protein